MIALRAIKAPFRPAKTKGKGGISVSLPESAWSGYAAACYHCGLCNGKRVIRMAFRAFRLAVPIALVMLLTPPPVRAEPVMPAFSRLVGVASWYGGKHNGRMTASGELMSAQRRTAAHPSLPLGTILRVVNLKNGRRTLVTVNDRGPFVDGRLLDLSERAARDLGMLGDGLARVSIELVGRRG